jgi:HK97 family phage portal protein
VSLFRGYRSPERRNVPVGGGGGTFNPFDRPTMPLASVALDGALGTGGGVDPLSGLGIPTAYRCVSLIANVIASCVLESIDRNGDASPWADWQNLVSYTPYEITELLTVHMAGWGNFYAFPVLGQGSVTRLLDLQPIFPGSVDVLRIDGKKTFRITTPTTGWLQPSSASSYRDYTEDQVFHIPFLGYDGLKGMSPIEWNAQTFATTIGANTLAERFMQNGQQLGGVLQVKAPLADQGQADAIKDAWQRSHGGAGNTGTVAVLDAETSFTPVTINPDNLQLIEGRTWQAQEVARIYGVPLTMLSFDSTGYGDAIETQQEGFVTYTVRQYTDRAEQRLARWFMPRGKALQFDLDGLMRGSTKERYDQYQSAINAGWMLRSEARDAEKMVALPSKYKLNEPIIANTYEAASALLETPAPVPAPVPANSDDVSSSSGSDSGSSSSGEDRSLYHRRRLRHVPVMEERAVAKSIADTVYNQLTEDYPKASLGWVHHVAWEEAPEMVPFDQINQEDKAGWRTSHEPENVASFASKIKSRIAAGKTALKKPAVVVDTPGNRGKYQIIDGHHRMLGSQAADGCNGLRAWVGHTDAAKGPWMELHDLQFTRKSGSMPHSGDDNASDQVGK